MSTDLTEKRTGPDVAGDPARTPPLRTGVAGPGQRRRRRPAAAGGAEPVRAAHAGGGVAEVGLVLGGRAVSLVLCLLVGGVLADRLKRTRILFGADLFRAVLILTAAAALPWLPLTAVPLLTMLMGAGEAMSRPAARSLIPTLLPDALLERGNALVAAAHRSSAVLGALLGVSLVALIGTRWALALAGVVFALGALTVLNVPEKPPGTPGQRRTVLADAAHGLRAVRHAAVGDGRHVHGVPAPVHAARRPR